MLANILPEQPLKSVADNGSVPAIAAPGLALLVDGAYGAGVALGLASYGPNVCTGGSASASSENNGTVAGDAFNGAEFTGSWQSNGMPAWIAYHFATPRAVAKLRISSLFSGGNQNLKDFTIEGSNDNANWTLLYTGQVPNSNGWHEFTFANSTPFLHVRLNVSSSWTGSGMNCWVWEIEMMEALPSTLKVKLDATGGGSVPASRLRYFTTETDTTKVTVKSSADGVTYAVHTVIAGNGCQEAAIHAAIRYITIDHLPSAPQTAYEVELLTERCARHAAPRWHNAGASARTAGAAYNAGFKFPIARDGLSRYGVYQRGAKEWTPRYHILGPSVWSLSPAYHLLAAAARHGAAFYHLRPPQPMLCDPLDRAELPAIITGLLKTGGVTPPAALPLWNGKEDAGLLRMANIRLGLFMHDGAYAGTDLAAGAEAVAQKWVELKSAGTLGAGAVDDQQAVFTPVGGDPATGALSVGDIPAGAGRLIHLRLGIPASVQTVYSAAARLAVIYDAMPQAGYGRAYGRHFGG